MDGCIEFQGCRHKFGYGLKKIGGKNRLAHRVAYCEHHGLALADIKGVFIRHKCDNPPCVNPDHLEPGTPADNMRDMAERGRSMRGEKNFHAKLTDGRVREIRSIYKAHSREFGASALARRYGVSMATLKNALHGKSWVCVGDADVPIPTAHKPKGVAWHKSSRKWQARVKVNGKSHYIGLFNSEEEAKAAYMKAAAELRAESQCPTPSGGKPGALTCGDDR